MAPLLTFAHACAHLRSRTEKDIGSKSSAVGCGLLVSIVNAFAQAVGVASMMCCEVSASIGNGQHAIFFEICGM